MFNLSTFNYEAYVLRITSPQHKEQQTIQNNMLTVTDRQKDSTETAITISFNWQHDSNTTYQ